MSDRTHRQVAFPTTRWTRVLRLRDLTDSSAEHTRLLTELCRMYWLPLYGFARRQGLGPHDAEDLTQGFFQHVLETSLFDQTSPERGRLRTYLLTTFANHIRDAHKHLRAKKRGGGSPALSIEAMTEEERHLSEPMDTASPEEIYNRRWAREFFSRVAKQMAAEYAMDGKSALHEALAPHLFAMAEAGHAEAAASLGVTTGNFRVMLTRFRRRYREIFRQAVADTLEDASDEAVDAEIQELIRLAAR